jgi:hypothetical protein
VIAFDFGISCKRLTDFVPNREMNFRHIRLTFLNPEHNSDSVAYAIIQNISEHFLFNPGKGGVNATLLDRLIDGSVSETARGFCGRGSGRRN